MNVLQKFNLIDSQIHQHKFLQRIHKFWCHLGHSRDQKEQRYLKRIKISQKLCTIIKFTTWNRSCCRSWGWSRNRKCRWRYRSWTHRKRCCCYNCRSCRQRKCGSACCWILNKRICRWECSVSACWPCSCRGNQLFKLRNVLVHFQNRGG